MKIDVDEKKLEEEIFELYKKITRLKEELALTQIELNKKEHKLAYCKAFQKNDKK